jgi:hypothetical protein
MMITISAGSVLLVELIALGSLHWAVFCGTWYLAMWNKWHKEKCKICKYNVCNFWKGEVGK